MRLKYPRCKGTRLARATLEQDIAKKYGEDDLKSLGEHIFFSSCTEAKPAPCAAYTRISAKDLGLRESWFRDSIFLQPELVIGPCRPTGRIPAGERWLPWKTEINFGSGPIDVLLVSSYGRIGIVETKLSYNPQKRREVVAQILDYALALQELELEDLPELPDSMEAPTEEDLREALDAGRFLLLIAGDALDSRALRLSQAMLASHLTSEWDLAMVDLNLYRESDASETIIIVPELLGAVAGEVRQVVRVAIEGTVSRANIVVERAVTEELVPRRTMPGQLSSTTEFLEQLKLDSPASASVAPKLISAFEKTAQASDGKIEFGLARNSANLYFRPTTGSPRRVLAFRTNGRFRVIQRYLRAAGLEKVAALLRTAVSPIIAVEKEAGSSGIWVNDANVDEICEALDRFLELVRGITQEGQR